MSDHPRVLCHRCLLGWAEARGKPPYLCEECEVPKLPSASELEAEGQLPFGFPDPAEVFTG